MQNITKYNKEIKQSQWDTPGITKPTVKLNNTNTKKKKKLLQDSTYIFCESYHVVPLSAQTGHMSIDIDTLFMFYPLQHGINDNKSSCSANTSTEIYNKNEYIFFC